MATFFGEVLPIFSRAVEEDDFDDDIKLEEVKIIPSSENDEYHIPSKIDHVLITVGRTASLFAKGNVLLEGKNLERNAWFLVVKDQQKYNDDHFVNGLNYSKENPVVISGFGHPTMENTLVLLCEKYVKPELTHSAINKILEHCKITTETNIVLLTSENWTGFKSPSCQLEYEDFPILRILPNTYYNLSALEASLIILEQPNFLAGIVAATLTECEVKKIPAAAVTCYENESVSLALENFRRLFLKSKILKRFLTNFDKIKIDNDQLDRGNLYV